MRPEEGSSAVRSDLLSLSRRSLRIRRRLAIPDTAGLLNGATSHGRETPRIIRLSNLLGILQLRRCQTEPRLGGQFDPIISSHTIRIAILCRAPESNRRRITGGKVRTVHRVVAWAVISNSAGRARRRCRRGRPLIHY
jgi:hypothetical protein